MDNYHIECQFFTAKMYQSIRNKKWHYQLAIKFVSVRCLKHHFPF